jgi:hypothetical protein
MLDVSCYAKHVAKLHVVGVVRGAQQTVVMACAGILQCIAGAKVMCGFVHWCKQ